ncbi:Flp pilus assembly protein TadG [Ferrimonas sediminum]|uniref:Flp pilus assembly protein TadG n=1 Tax=Ferrimonas sediminum TaxID=718193 RepID=A0A1G8YE79_9GAMM|nr:TadE/TadG family type IV pilus assembly protein [Ferrimonas sediminum]SDK00977.1 Flp pilus assembly protein TadG [Ferrimonas sediminum]
MKILRRHFPSRAPGKQRGAIVVLVTIALLTIVIMGAMALEGGHLLLSKSRLQNAVDSAALSGTLSLHEGNDHAGARQQATATLINVLGASDFSELSGDVDLSALSYNQNQVSPQLSIEFSLQPDPFVVTSDITAEYVRVKIKDVQLATYLGQAINMDKVTSASAVAGPSTPLVNCSLNLLPMMVCEGDTPGEPFGYPKGSIMSMKISSQQDAELGPGNFQLIRLGDSSGAADLRAAMAGESAGNNQCFGNSEGIETEPGNNVGPVATGMNTRLGIWHGGTVNATDHPRDKDICVGEALDVDDSDNIIYSSDGTLVDGTGPTPSLYRYSDYADNYEPGGSRFQNSCAATGTSWDNDGGARRREFAIVVGDCEGQSNGQNDIPFKGFACFYFMQEVIQKGNLAYVIGEFVEDCTGSGNATDDVTATDGPFTFVLYRDPDNKDS